MKDLGIKISLFLNYFVFAILLNSVGILIRKSQEVYAVSELAASSLEFFKDMTIAVASFVMGSLLMKIGFKRGILAALTLVLIGCLAMYFGDGFGYVQLLFACTGISFAIVKVSVYAIMGKISSDENSLKSNLSSIEAFFMIGIATAYFLFPLFYSDSDASSWLRIYLVLAGLILVTILIVLFSDLDTIQQDIQNVSLKDSLRKIFGLMKLPIVAVFAVSAFFYVMTEQGIMSWLPSFNEKVLHLSPKMSDTMAVILALSIALGRYLTSFLVKRSSWLLIIIPSIILAALLLILVLPKAQGLEVQRISEFSQMPVVAFVFPLIGLFLAPIYPLINSVVLGATDKSLHTPMSGLLTFFSALGGTLGSFMVAYLFRTIGGDKAFYFALIPMAILTGTIFLLNRISSKR